MDPNFYNSGASSSSNTSSSTNGIQVIETQSVSSSSAGPMLDKLSIKAMRRMIEEAVLDIQVSVWEFQPDVEKKAKTQLIQLLSDEWCIISHMKPSPISSISRIRTRDKLVEHYHSKMMQSYVKWCRISMQKTKNVEKVFESIFPENIEYRYLADMLLLLMIYGECDIFRSQNNVIMLLFQACKKFIETSGALPERYSQMKLNHYGPIVPRKSVGELIRHECRFLNELLNIVGFNRKKRNQYFFAWEDLNTNCVTKPFVSKFLKYYSFQKCFRIHNTSVLGNLIAESIAASESTRDSSRMPNIFVSEIGSLQIRDQDLEMIDLSKPRHEQPVVMEPVISLSQMGSSEQVLIDQAKQEKEKKKRLQKNIKLILKERNEFVRTWKTYVDRAGGPCGCFGYLTMLNTFAIPIYIQLILFSIMMYLFIDFPYFERTIRQPIAMAVLCGSPLALVLLLAVFQFITAIFTSIQWFHPYKFWLPRRSAWSTFRFGNVLNYLLWLVIFVLQMVIVRFAVFDLLKTATYILLDQILENLYDGFSIAIFVLAWIPVFLVYWTTTPILFQVITSCFGFVYSLFKRVNRVTSWSDFQSKLRSKITLLHFCKKVLGLNHGTISIEKTQYRFAYFFNSIIEDCFQDYLCSQIQKEKLSFDLSAYHSVKEIPRDVFLEQVKRINSVTPKNSELRRQLIKFMNNLYLNMPFSTGVESMRKLTVITPVYKESILYTWDELVKMENTGDCFLGHIMNRHPYEWRNFRDSLTEHRQACINLEQKILSGVDVEGHYVPLELVEEIRYWASLRFQSVARTVHGMMKIPKMLKMLLKVQKMDDPNSMSEEAMDQLIHEKFSYLMGAQLLDKCTWSGDGSHENYYRDFMTLLQIHSNHFKVAYQKRSADKTWKAVLLKKDETTQQIVEEFEVETFGRFDSKGQGKPTHQAFLMQFCDGSVIETIDCNQTGFYSQYTFIPNLLMQFIDKPNTKIIGFPEHVFTDKWSVTGYGAAFVEKTFGSLIQRSWNLLSMRMHYGHPDVVDSLWVMFTTGLSKLSYVSEDIFTGFDTVLNGGKIDFIDFMEVGKARDVDLFSTSKFNRKCAGGAGQVAVGREIRELMYGFKLNLAERLTLFYSTIGHYYLTQVILVSTFIVYFVRIIVLILRISQVILYNGEESPIGWSIIDILFVIQLGFIMSIPGLFQAILDLGFFRAMYDYVLKCKFVIVSLYSIFHQLQQSLYFHYGFIDAAQYIASGRGSGLHHESIGKVIVAFDTSHFIPCCILFVLTWVSFALSLPFGAEGLPYLFFGLILSSLWLYSPLLFNKGSAPIDVPYETWLSLYANDLDYVKKWKIRHIITELAKRRKDFKKVEKYQKEIVDNTTGYGIVWGVDVQAIHEEYLGSDDAGKDFESHGISSSSSEKSSEHMMMDAAFAAEAERDFKFQYQGKSNWSCANFIWKVKLLVQTIFWNVFLLFTLTGMKYLCLFFILLQFLNPFGAPMKKTVRKIKKKEISVEKRFLAMQKFLREQFKKNNSQENLLLRK